MNTLHQTAKNFNDSKSPSAAEFARTLVTDPEARRKKQHHQQNQHVINRMTARMGFPDKAARCVAGVHGLLNGRETHSFPALIAHKHAARQFNYAGKEENSDVFMGRYLDALKEAEIKAGRRCFNIERADKVTTIITTYHADYIGEVALWALEQAKASEEWAKCPAKAITDELIDRAIAKLPVYEKPSPGNKSDGPSITDGAVIKGLWTKSDTYTEAAMRKVAAAGGDPLAALEEVHRRQRRIAVEVRREQLERDRKAREDEAATGVPWITEAEKQADGKNISDNSEKFSTGNETLSDARRPTGHPTDCRMPSPEVPIDQQVNFGADEKGDSPKLRAALASIAEGIPVLALWGVADGMCDCPKGSECPSPGKHPYPKFSPNGVYSATSDASKARMWYAKDPRINFGQVMGGEQNIICVDVDPRNDGDASYFDLEQKHGPDAWPVTREKRTGGGGWHKLYRLPEAVKAVTGELKAKLGPGVDIKGAGGLIVAAGSAHVSGQCYGVENGEPIAAAPEWIGKAVRKAATGEQPEQPVDFQAYRERRRTKAPGAVRYFEEGERNDGLRDVMCGRWTNGYAVDASDLYRQMLEVRDTRCAPGKDAPATDAQLWEMVQRTVRKFARGEIKRGVS